MHNTLRLLQPIPLLQLTALLQAIQLVDILQPLMAGRAMATAQDHPTSCAKLSERARLVTVAPTLSPMPNGKPLSGASDTAESASSAIAFRRPDYWPSPPRAIRVRAADRWPRPSMNGRIEKIGERHGKVGQRRKDHGHHGSNMCWNSSGRHPPRCAPTRTEWIGTILLPN